MAHVDLTCKRWGCRLSTKSRHSLAILGLIPAARLKNAHGFCACAAFISLTYMHALQLSYGSLPKLLVPRWGELDKGPVIIREQSHLLCHDLVLSGSFPAGSLPEDSFVSWALALLCVGRNRADCVGVFLCRYIYMHTYTHIYIHVHICTVYIYIYIHLHISISTFAALYLHV